MKKPWKPSAKELAEALERLIEANQNLYENWRKSITSPEHSHTASPSAAGTDDQ